MFKKLNLTMKIFVISFLLLAAAFILIQGFALYSQKGIEKYSYIVSKEYESFEIREYEPTLFTSVTLPTNKFEDASKNGFSILAGYIFGGNENNEKISMTSPVTMSIEDSVTMMFMVPKSMAKNSLPTPNDSSILFVKEPAKTVAAIEFGGWANQEKIEKYKNMLISNLKNEGISFSNKYYFFGYNAPYEVFNRKNEIIIELESE